MNRYTIKGSNSDTLSLSSFPMWISSERKEFAPLGANSFFSEVIRVDLLLEGIVLQGSKLKVMKYWWVKYLQFYVLLPIFVISEQLEHELMKRCMQWKIFSRPSGLESRTARSAGQRLTYGALGAPSYKALPFCNNGGKKHRGVLIIRIALRSLELLKY